MSGFAWAGAPVLVTGATGFVGRHLVGALSARGARVRILARKTADTAGLPPGLELAEGDMTDFPSLAAAVAGCRVVFHLASIVQGAQLPDSAFRAVHVEGTRALFESAALAGVERVLHCSTIGVMGSVDGEQPAGETAPIRAEDIYQVTKHEGEEVALGFFRSGRLRGNVVRPSAVYGPGDRRLLKLFRAVARGRFVMIGDGRVLIHPVYVGDLVEGMLLAAGAQPTGEVFILGGDRYLPLRSWAELIARAAGRGVRAWRIPVAPVMAAACVCEAVCRTLGLRPWLYRRRVQFFTKNRFFDISKARRLLGYSPSVSLETGAQKTLAWYREQGWI